MNLWRIINPLVALIARSPFHFLISSQVLVINFKGIKTGKNYLIPVSYHQDTATYICTTLRSNLWWRNLKNQSEVHIWLKGSLVNARVQLEYTDNQIVEKNLKHLVSGNIIDAFFAKIKLEKDGSPNANDLSKAAKIHMVLKFMVS